MKKVFAKMKVLMSEIKEPRLLKSQKFHKRYEMDPEFLGRVITGDGT